MFEVLVLFRLVVLEVFMVVVMVLVVCDSNQSTRFWVY